MYTETTIQRLVEKVAELTARVGELEPKVEELQLRQESVELWTEDEHERVRKQLVEYGVITEPKQT